jgi:serine/threonine protein kinase
LACRLGRAPARRSENGARNPWLFSRRRGQWAWPASLQRLLREARAIARLSHPHIVAIHHVGQWEGGHFLVLEFMPGSSLQDRLERAGAMRWPEASRALGDACWRFR